MARSRWYPAKTITDADYADDWVLLADTPAQAESLLHNLEQAAGYHGLYMNANKTEYMCFKQKETISTLSGKLLRLVNQFTYLNCHSLSTESDVNICLAKAWNVIDRLLIIWKSHLFNKIKWDFFQAVTVSIQLCGCTI